MKGHQGQDQGNGGHGLCEIPGQDHNGLARPGRAVNWIQALGFLITRVGVPIVTLVPLSKTLDYYWLVLWIGRKASERILFILFIS